MPSQHIEANKGLYRRLDAMLGELHSRESGVGFFKASLGAIFESFGAEVGMEGAQLLKVEASEASPVARFGTLDDQAGPPISELGRLQDLAQRMHMIEFPRPPLGPLAAFGIVEAERAFVFLFAFRPGWERDSVELLLNTASSILQAKLSEERLGAVMKQAAEIQQSLLPPSVPMFPGFEIAARSLPAEEVGGDWFDFLPLGEGMLGISIGDASGHGLPAALMARDVVIGLRMGIEKELKTGHVLEKLNRVLHRSTLSSCFASLLFGELEENGSFFYYNAGHDVPLMLTEQGCKPLRTGGPVLGPLPEVRLRRHFAHIDHGAALVLHSDGLIERRSSAGELFGLDRLRETLFEARSKPAALLLDHVFETVERFAQGGAGRDDATLVIVRRLERRALPRTER